MLAWYKNETLFIWQETLFARIAFIENSNHKCNACFRVRYYHYYYYYYYGPEQISRNSDLLRAGRSEDRILEGARFSAPVYTGPGALSASYTMVPEVKRSGHGIDHPHSSKAEVKERVELYIYSPFGPSWSVLGWTLPLVLLLLLVVVVVVVVVVVETNSNSNINGGGRSTSRTTSTKREERIPTRCNKIDDLLSIPDVDYWLQSRHISDIFMPTIRRKRPRVTAYGIFCW